MKLSTLASKPQLVEVTLDDEDTIKEYGEAITFHTWDRQPMDIFMKLAQQTEASQANAIEIVKDLILDEAGNKLLTQDSMLPTKVLMRAIYKVTSLLGN
jgi:hypothetical protein